MTETITLDPTEGGFEVSGPWAADQVPAPLDEAIDPRAESAGGPSDAAVGGQDGDALSGAAAGAEVQDGSALSEALASASGDATAEGAETTQGGIFSAASLKIGRAAGRVRE